MIPQSDARTPGAWQAEHAWAPIVGIATDECIKGEFDMNAQGSRIILYPVATPEEEQRLVQQLHDVGYPQVVKAKNLDHLRSLSRDESFAVLVVLFTDTNFNQNQLLERFPPLKSLPVIGLFSADCARFDLPFVQTCQEVAIWPCSGQELNYRIGKRLSSFDSHPSLGHKLFVQMNILGNSPEFLQVLDHVSKVIKCDAPVYLDGETGTGKDLIARAIHYLGERKDHPYIAANCGAFPDQLIENELFGHQRGAYTDARESCSGLIAQAEGGTLFLDEIEALSLKGQVTLLRFIENMNYRPLGGTAAKLANVRVITATNESVEKLVAAGSFRKDLYYRINVMSILLPPLRARAGDITLLADHFLRRLQIQYQRPGLELHPASREALKYYDWPGNVRELENMLHREFLLTDGQYVVLDEIEASTRERRHPCSDRRLRKMFGQPLVKAKSSLINEFEQQYLAAALDRAKGNISAAARLAGKERRSFTRLLQKYDLDNCHYKAGR
jgi:DNA-binding NtrC family response regulator